MTQLRKSLMPEFAFSFFKKMTQIKHFLSLPDINSLQRSAIFCTRKVIEKFTIPSYIVSNSELKIPRYG